MGPQTLIPRINQDSLSLSAEQDISSSTNIFAQVLGTNRHSLYVNSIGAGTYFSDWSVKQLGVSAGISHTLEDGIVLQITGTHSRVEDDENRTELLNGNVTKTSRRGYNNRLYSLQSQVSGTLFDLPTGEVEFSIGAGIREEKYRDTASTLPIQGERRIKYGWGEGKIPLLSIDGRKILTLSAAARYEDYSDFGNITTPKIGLEFKPQEGIRFRGSWGSSFRAPSLLQVNGNSQLYLLSARMVDPSAEAQKRVLLRLGSSPELGPEKANTWTAGFDFTPSRIPGLRIRPTYYVVRYKDRIVVPIGNLGAALTDPALASFIRRDPSLKEQQELVDNASTFSNFVGGAYVPSDVIAVIENQYQNVQRQNVSGFDIDIDYQTELKGVTLDLFANFTHLKITTKFTPISDQMKISGTTFNPPSNRFRAGVTASYRAVTSNITLNYMDGFLDRTPPTFRPVSSYSTLDFVLGLEPRSGPLKKFFARLAVQNALDANLPRLAPNATSTTGIGFDGTNASPIGRYVSFTLGRRW